METCNILGTNINVLNMETAKNYIYDNLESLRGQYICVSNVHTTVMAHDHKSYQTVQNEAALRLPDGGPLSAVSRMRGYKDAARVTGPDLMKELFEEAKTNGLRMYFYGSKEDILEKMKEKLLEKYPDIQIVGMYSPPFRQLTEEEDRQIVERIKATSPDIVWIGLGAPKQEVWMHAHKGRLSGVMVGVGAGFDYFAERIRRAPKWIQKANLEWLYRLCQEPKRLFKRYLVTNTKFIVLVMKETLTRRKK